MAGSAPVLNLPDASGLRIAIVTATWNSHITHALRNGAVNTLKAAGVNPKDIHAYDVPGTVELTFAAAKLVAGNPYCYDAIIIIGCVIRGDTPHFDYVCQSVTQGMTDLNARGKTPVIFSVLTVENEQQALDRAGGALGNKGSEAAEAAIVMAKFAKSPLRTYRPI